MLHSGCTPPCRIQIGAEIIDRVHREQIEKCHLLNGKNVAMSVDG